MRVFKRAGSPSWQYELSTPTGKKRYSAKTTVKKDAVFLATYKQQQVNNMVLFDKKPCITLGEACRRYLEEQQGKAPATYLNAKFNVRHLLDGTVWHSETAFESIKASQVLKLQMLKRPLSNNSINHLTTALVTMKNRAEIWDVQGPEFKVKKLKVGKKFRYLMDGEEELLLAACQNRDLKDLIIMLVDTGLRIGDAVRVMWSDINEEHGNARIFLFTAKTDEAITLPVTKRLKEVLARRLELSYSAYVFPHAKIPGAPRTPASKGIRLAAARAGLNTPEIVSARGKFTAHSLRDTYATRLIKRGLSLYDVQTMLGHSSPQQSQKYAHLTTEDIRVRVLRALEA